MTSPSGRTVSLSGGAYAAEVVEVGAGLRTLRRDGVDIVAGYGPDEMCASGRGQTLLPWPNRIEDGSYDFDGHRLQLGLSEAAKHNASHGLVRWVNWTLAESSPSRALWHYRLHPQPGYPFLLDLTVEYSAGPDGLRVTQAAVNLGDAAAPYGAGAHPYLTVGRSLDACELTLPASTWCEIDGRGLPGTPQSVDGGRFDFRSARLIGPDVLDHPFGSLGYEGGVARAVLRDPESTREVSLTVDESYRWLQAFTGDTLAQGARESLAVEPMTCPANAFRSGTNLVRLEPGESHRATFTIA